MSESSHIAETSRVLPKDGIAGLKENWKQDILSGFLVFLIALPLCLGIAIASGVPPFAGIISAIVGGLVVSLINGAYVTVNGPAAGLIVVILAGVEQLGHGDPMLGYRLTLAAIVIAGIVQIIFGLVKAGKLSAFFPAPAVHGLLAAIGIIIMSKQIHTMFGVKPQAHETLEIIAEIPHSIIYSNPDIAIIGVISLLLMIILPRLKNPWLRMIPAPLIVVVTGILLGHYFDLEHTHVYALGQHEFSLGPEFLVTLPNNIMAGIVYPDFSGMFTGAFAGVVISIALIASLETLLSAAAVDKLDPYGRHANLNKDLTAMGVGTALSGLIGGLPMIAEIVRSSANITNGAKTRWANFSHGLFMLVFVAFAPGLIHQIPLAALAALLVVTGFRLASPREFIATYKLGKDQFLIFMVTVLATLATDLLIGIGCGIALNLIMHKWSGLSIKQLFTLRLETKQDHEWIVHLQGPAVFSNMLILKNQLEEIAPGHSLVLDFSETTLVDHTVMEFVTHFQHDYQRQGGTCRLMGLDGHQGVSEHPLATRRKMTPVST